MLIDLQAFEVDLGLLVLFLGKDICVALSQVLLTVDLVLHVGVLVFLDGGYFLLILFGWMVGSIEENCVQLRPLVVMLRLFL